MGLCPGSAALALECRIRSSMMLHRFSMCLALRLWWSGPGLAPLRFMMAVQRMLKRGVDTLKMEDYQILYCKEGLAIGDELERLKNMSSSEHYVRRSAFILLPDACGLDAMPIGRKQPWRLRAAICMMVYLVPAIVRLQVWRKRRAWEAWWPLWPTWQNGALLSASAPHQMLAFQSRTVVQILETSPEVRRLESWVPFNVCAGSPRLDRKALRTAGQGSLAVGPYMLLRSNPEGHLHIPHSPHKPHDALCTVLISTAERYFLLGWMARVSIRPGSKHQGHYRSARETQHICWNVDKALLCMPGMRSMGMRGHCNSMNSLLQLLTVTAHSAALAVFVFRPHAESAQSAIICIGHRGLLISADHCRQLLGSGIIKAGEQISSFWHRRVKQ